jgi:hypothetical protein
VNLLGDPTLHAFMLAPPTALRAQMTRDGMALTWTRSIDPDVQGYRLYRRAGTGPMVALNHGALVPDTHFTDPDPAPGATYMVRAYGLRSVYAGSFYTLSQGVFAGPDNGPPGTADPVTVTTSPGRPVALPDGFDTPRDGVIRAVIAPPDVGDLRLEGATWRYVPAQGFTGEVDMSYARSDAWQTQVGRLSIIVTDASPPAPAVVDGQH